MSNIAKNTSLSACLDSIRFNKMDWIIKRLTGNDTGLTGGHQAGIYLPKEFFKRTFPQIHTTTIHNPRISFDCSFPVNQADPVELRAIYYNSKFFPELGLKKKYDEFRITGWGGKSSPTQCHENTGSIFLFAVSLTSEKPKSLAIVAENRQDEALIEEWIGQEVDPGIFYSSYHQEPQTHLLDRIPPEWRKTFPSGTEIFEQVLRLLPWNGIQTNPDKLLLARRKLEFEIFAKVERDHVLPKIKSGFTSVDDFISQALSVANRRKSRTGNSLELNLAAIFRSENILFDAQKESENRKKPDFLFPSARAYQNPNFPCNRLTMLAAKTCCKDRWRQALSEADRIRNKHLFTLQEGISSNQLSEMETKHLTLVVPEPNLSSFPKDWRPKILSLHSFISVVRQRQSS